MKMLRPWVRDWAIGMEGGGGLEAGMVDGPLTSVDVVMRVPSGSLLMAATFQW